MKRWLFVFLLIGGFFGLPEAGQAQHRERVLIRTGKPYTNLVSTLRGLGATVTYQYKHVDAIAAEIPRDVLPTVRNLVGANAITKDAMVPNPAPVNTLRKKTIPGMDQVQDVVEVLADSVEPIAEADLSAFAAANPNAYLINNTIMNVSALHAGGFTGAGVIVAVVDSGIRPGFPHLTLDGSVVGCEDFVGDALGCSNSANNFHGTFVAGMISANVVFGFSTASSFRNAVLAHCPDCFLNPPTNTYIPMLGSAPLSNIYALRVFGPTGSAPTSRILAALERAIDLRELYDAGDPAGVNIRVLNMSLGGPTIFAGRDLFDSFVNVLLQKDIVLVTSAGNAGPSSLTTASPGSSFGAITVGAASHAHNERILRELQLPSSLGTGRGALFRPFPGTETAYFSSRGPDADGRLDPDVVANGFASFGQGQGSASTITIGSGTSFSAPSVAGVAAVLRQAFPGATARQIRNAIIASANPAILADDSTKLDQGKGFVNAQAAFDLLAAGHVPDWLPIPPWFTKFVGLNVERSTRLNVHHSLFVREHVKNLKPAERSDILFYVWPFTERVTITLSNVTPALPPEQQNQLFGDDILFAVHSAKTSAIPTSAGEGDYQVFDFVTGGTFVVEDPEPGLLRITVNGDWTNAGTISADVAISSDLEFDPRFSALGKIADGQTKVFSVNIPPGVANAQFKLAWPEGWENYPANDIDMILIDPNGALNQAGASLRAPELATVQNPLPGTWFVAVDGFEVSTGTDQFKLRVSLDGKVVKVQ